MKEWNLRRYSPDCKREWDEFVRASRNASFMHLRDYMDYHAERFPDHSLMAFKGERLLALLPATVSVRENGEKILSSHRGLTYGGWLLPEKHLDGEDLLEIFGLMVNYCRGCGLSAVDYKPIPFIYAEVPSQEDIYALFRFGAQVSECNLSETIALECNPGFNTLQRRHLRKAEALVPSVIVRELTADEDVEAFYRMLSDCIGQRYSARPVHSLYELLLLRSRFPEEIRFYGAEYPGESGMMLQAGVCLYIWRGVAHCQYIATTAQGRALNLLTPLFRYLIEDEFHGFRYFDFGTSNENGGRMLNAGLLRQKASYGASGTAYMRYSLPL